MTTVKWHPGYVTPNHQALPPPVQSPVSVCYSDPCPDPVGMRKPEKRGYRSTPAAQTRAGNGMGAEWI